MKRLVSPALLAVLIVAGVLLYQRQSTAPSPAQPTNAPADQLRSQVLAWQNYALDTTIALGAGECGNEEFSTLIQSVKKDQRVLKLNNSLTLVSTLNPLGWSNERFLAFNDDPTAVCAAGGIYPFHAYPDRLLWKGVCSSGAIPVENTSERATFNRCLTAEAALQQMTF